MRWFFKLILRSEQANELNVKRKVENEFNCTPYVKDCVFLREIDGKIIVYVL